MIYFHGTKGDINYYDMIEAIDDRVGIDMQKSAYLKAYKEQTICEVCVYDFEIKEIYRNTWCISEGEIDNDDIIEAFADEIE